MKAVHIFMTFALILSLSLVACKDEDFPEPPNEPPNEPVREPDYRDTLAGTFSYTGYFESEMLNSLPTYDTTVGGTLTVTVVDSTTNQVRFAIATHIVEYAILNTNGDFSRTIPQYRSGFSGSFYATDSLRIETEWSTNGAYYNARYFCKRQ